MASLSFDSDILPFSNLDDISFNLAMFELDNGPVNFDADRLASLNYNPLFSVTNRHLTLSNDVDPDLHFYGNLNSNCDYFTEAQFNEKVKSESHGASAPQFSILHLNIRSLEHNLSNLTDLLNNVDIKFSVIGITETWLRDLVHLVDLNGFNFFHKHRSGRVGGGVGLYLSNNFTAKSRDDLCFDDDELAESLFIEINKSIGENIIVGAIYRPPNQSVENFLTKYNALIFLKKIKYVI